MKSLNIDSAEQNSRSANTVPEELRWLHCFVPDALLAKYSQGDCETALQPGKDFGERLVALSVSYQHATNLADSPYCTKKRAFDVYIWAYPEHTILSASKQDISLEDIAGYTPLLLRLRSFEDVYVVDNVDGETAPSSADRINSNPAKRRSELRRAATLQPITNSLSWGYQNPVILLQRPIASREIVEIV